MKAYKLLPLLLAVLLLTITACSKKTMENQSTSTMEPETTAQAEPEPKPVEPEATPEPQADDQDADGLADLTTTHVYFNFDSAVLQADAQELLRVKAKWLKDHPGIAVVRIEGHCDERGTEAYNLALGARRAEAVKQYMANMGLNGIKLKTLSYGEEKPANPANNETAWSMNRRACFVIDQ